MTDEQFYKAKELKEKEKYYTQFLGDLRWEQKIKRDKDAEARNNIENWKGNHNDEWQLKHFFHLLFRNDKKTGQGKICCRPWIEFERGVEVEADPELIEMIVTML